MDALALKFGDWEIAHDEDERTQIVMDNRDMVPMCGIHVGTSTREYQESKQYESSGIANKEARNCDLWSVLRQKLESCTIITQEGVSVGKYFLMPRAAHAHVSVGAEATELEQIFNGLVKNWKEATGGYSVTTRRYGHLSYQSILVLKEDVIPLILRELQQRPDWWFEALKALTKENPVAAGATFEEAVNAWIDWGKRNHRIP